MSTLRLNVPRRLIAAAQAVHDPSQMIRFIGLHGGRGGAKSHFFAEQAISRCVNGGARIACLREYQTSTKDSVKQLLSDKIEALGLSSL